MESPRDDLDEQIRRNQSTRASHPAFAGHRARVMRLLLSAIAESLGRPHLILLGAGNCNDVDLAILPALCSQIDLVDWDAEALAAAIQRQGVSNDASFTVHAPLDLSSSDWILRLSSQEARPTIVASLCVLSQLIETAAKLAGQQPQDLATRLKAIQRQHLQQIVELLPGGGIGLLITDFASSLTAPELATTAEAQLPAVVGRLLQAGNFFHGLHPGGLYRDLTSDPWFVSRISCHNPTPPWNWNVGNRVYAVSALVMRRKLASTGMIEP